jgi:acetyltransferase-like isoleucine patch superfamily enzyme
VDDSKQVSTIAKLRRRDFHEWMTALTSLGTRLKSRLYYPLIFGSFGKASLLSRPIALTKPQHIRIGQNVNIRPGARLEVIVLHPLDPPELRIGNNVGIEQNVHIVCHHRVIIEDNVSVTANCSIVDTTHPFDDLPYDAKVGANIQDDDGFVEIGEGTFLGIGCVVLPNVRIGKGCVIGAHSVVTRNIPDYSVAFGAPAVVIRSIRKIPSEPEG